MGYFTFDELIHEHSSLTHHVLPSHVSIKVQQFPLELVLWVCVLFGNVFCLEMKGKEKHSIPIELHAISLFDSNFFRCSLYLGFTKFRACWVRDF